MSVARPARAELLDGQRKRGGQTALLFMIRYAHPRVQYLAMLPVYWVLYKKGARLELAHSDVKGSGLAHFDLCF